MTQKIIDLSMMIEEGMVTFNAYWHPAVEIVQLGSHEKEGRETRKIVIGTHTGTHIDAPRHFIDGGETIESIPLDRLVGTASVLDLSKAKGQQEIGVQELEAALGGHKATRVILRFDWDSELRNDSYYTDHPFLSEKACRWLVDQGCILIAMDTPQLDDPKNGRGSEKDSPNHKILLGNGVVLVEYLINIREISQPEVDLVVAPIKLRGSDGAPVRCFAIEGS